MSQTLFQKIASKQIPAEIVYESDSVLAFKDINPKAPVHILVVPKKPIPRVGEACAEDQGLLGAILLAAAEIAKRQGLDSTGYRLVINNGRDGGESVPHLHCHLLGGRSLGWPPG